MRHYEHSILIRRFAPRQLPKPVLAEVNMMVKRLDDDEQVRSDEVLSLSLLALRTFRTSEERSNEITKAS